MTEQENRYILQIMLEANIKGDKAAVHATIMQKLALQINPPPKDKKKNARDS